MWSTLYGGGNYDYARGLAIDTAGNIYISGSTSSGASIASGDGRIQKVVVMMNSLPNLIAMACGFGQLIWVEKQVITVAL